MAGVAGGKGANLGELSRIGGVRVPGGFCVTTEAFERVLHEGDAGDVEAAIRLAVDPDAAYAVRSSATAEDSAETSFAGQHDSYLNVVGEEAVLDRIRQCWASLFTERAVAYRQRNGIPDSDVRMAVVVQRMVVPQAAGVMFTADPVTGNRRIVSIDAVAGLGEALVSGLVNPDVYQVRDGVVTDRRTAPGGGILKDPDVVRLAALGRRIESHFGSPQDIEWCRDADGFAVVQSRPITTLFPIPVVDDDANHVYVSVGHQQMMTEAMKPLGISVWKATSPGHMVDAGGRLFVDVTPRLSAALVQGLGRSDPLIGDALQTIVDRKDFVPLSSDVSFPGAPGGPDDTALPNDPAIVAELVAAREASLETLKRDIATKTGVELLDFVITDIQQMRQILFDPRNMPAILAGMQGSWWLNEHVAAWLGEKNVADTLTQSAPGNVTSAMGLALLDVADVIRPYPAVVAFLQDDGPLERLPEVTGGRAAYEAILRYLDDYGMRCVGEIDITRPRWSEQPDALYPMILSNVRNAAPGEGARRFEQGRQEALRKEESVLARLRELPDGEAKAAETKQMIDRVRTFIGYREYPKYHLVSRYFVYKKALLSEAGMFRDPEDVFYLTLEEFRDVVRTRQVDERLIGERKAAFRSYLTLSAPRVLTSEGEALTGAYRRDDLPAGALAGLPVSAGTVEGRARVVHDMAEADLEPGDILVTAYTDPSWTPAFVSVSGLVTEVGGQMTHGAVIAREYGLPAVVGVENATALITDGRRIRVHGTAGWVELLD
ncbi:phosphoenolpyruvate synthase [Actinoplanes sp. OR16]|uniref:phosphoenolpyruvate synthase n=1 Tax=Actinoplanes sp. OR16 TaxID=946334 RepID=UPI000FD91716|nr:phosphoenolpyruvate synthase [Actinoplanes sp. OR16]